MGGGPKRILSLDGGGVRGIIAIAFLERIEKLLGEIGGAKSPPRLVDCFDLVGGTSTGAIIASGIALGRSAAELGQLYRELAKKVFRPHSWLAGLAAPVFDGSKLKRILAEEIGDIALDSSGILTGLAIVLKRVDTGSVWILSNNPKSKWWDSAETKSANRHLRLADLVRASTAAPFYFSPHEIEIAEGQRGSFIDGGMSPFNNPALAMLQVATIPAYGFGWPVGAGNLHIISIGTGNRRYGNKPGRTRKMIPPHLAYEVVLGISNDLNDQVMTLMQVLGTTKTPWTINSEIGDLGGFLLPQQPLFSFERFDVRLEEEWVKTELGTDLTVRQMRSLTDMTNADIIPLAYDLGQAAAERQVTLEHVRSLSVTASSDAHQAKLD